MKKIRVDLKEKGYDIIVGSGILGSLGSRIKDMGRIDSVVAITNPCIKKLWGGGLSKFLNRNGIYLKFMEIADTEKSKSAKTALGLLNRIAVFGRSRTILIIAFGGGVVGDVAGFVASVYKRGVPYIQLPTTLLAQVDSAIGGKVALDLDAGKNLVGSFYQPRLVFSDMDFLKSLPKKQIINGLAEVVKCAIIKDAALFQFLENNISGILKLDARVLEHIVARTSLIKARIVEQDQFDRLGVRMVLNYGHTIGHAIETAGGYTKRYSHGEAVSIGMTAANFIAARLDRISEEMELRIGRLFKRAGLPTRAKGLNRKKIYEAHLFDKKFSGGRNLFVLPEGIGKAAFAENVSMDLVKKAIDMVCG